ncbi:MAG: metallophosphoesterase [Deltaproteobacteria bacterium]
MKPVVLRDGLELHAPGGVYIPGERTLVIADVHAGYTHTLRSRGYGVPGDAEHGLLARLRALRSSVNPTRVVIAGDLVHGAAAARGDDDSPLAYFLAALADLEVTVVLGNHDHAIGEWLCARGVRAVRDVAIGPFRVHHGDDPERVRVLRDEALDAGGRVLLGHLHPAVWLEGDAGVRALLPAFVTARGVLCLPALSPYARGVDVRDARMREDLRALAGDVEMGVACVIAGRTVVALGVILPAEG